MRSVIKLLLLLLLFEGPSHGSALTWHLRMKIALDTARWPSLNSSLSIILFA